MRIRTTVTAAAVAVSVVLTTTLSTFSDVGLVAASAQDTLYESTGDNMHDGQAVGAATTSRGQMLRQQHKKQKQQQRRLQTQQQLQHHYDSNTYGRMTHQRTEIPFGRTATAPSSTNRRLKKGKSSSDDNIFDNDESNLIECPAGEFPYSYRLALSNTTPDFDAFLVPTGGDPAFDTIQEAIGSGSVDLNFFGCVTTGDSIDFNFALAAGDSLQNNLVGFDLEVGNDVGIATPTPAPSGKSKSKDSSSDSSSSKSRRQRRHRGRGRRRRRGLARGEEYDEDIITTNRRLKKGKSSKSSDDDDDDGVVTMISFTGDDFLDGAGTLGTVFQGTFVEGAIIQAFGTDATGAAITEGAVSASPSMAPSLSTAPSSSTEAPVSSKSGKSSKGGSKRRQ